MQTTRDNARFLVEDKHAHYLLPVLGNQPTLNAALGALDWQGTPVAAATVETGDRIEVFDDPAGRLSPHLAASVG